MKTNTMKNGMYNIKITGSIILMALLAFRQHLAGQELQKPVSTVISGSVNPWKEGMLVHVEILNEYSSGNSSFVADTLFSTGAKEGRFSLALPPAPHPFYIRVYTTDSTRANRNYDGLSLDQYLAFPGDDIFIRYDQKKDVLGFSGRGAGKYTFRYDSDRAIAQKTGWLKPDINREACKWAEGRDSIISLQMELLNQRKDKLGLEEYILLKADIIGANLSNMFRTMTDHSFGLTQKDTANFLQGLKLYGERYYQLSPDTTNAGLLQYSLYYSEYLLNKAVADVKYQKKKGVSGSRGILDVVRSMDLPAPLHEKTIVAYYYRQQVRSALADSDLVTALTLLKTQTYRNEIIKLIRASGQGEMVSDYPFSDPSGKVVRLTDLKGKVVLLDMWFTGCTGCVQVAKELPKVEKSFENDTNVVFVSLSVDKDKSRWLKSIDKYHGITLEGTTYHYTHYISDSTLYWYTGGRGWDNEFIRKYNPLDSYPHLMLIGKDGRIFTSSPPDPRTSVTAIVQKIREALAQ